MLRMNQRVNSRFDAIVVLFGAALVALWLVRVL